MEIVLLTIKYKSFFFRLYAQHWFVSERILTDTVQILKNLPSLVQCGI